MNVWTFDGYLAKDPEMRYTGEGTAVTNMRVGVRSGGRRRDGEKDLFTNVTVWGKQGEVCADILRKGSYVVVSGSLHEREYEVDGDRRTQQYVNATDVSFGPKVSDDDGQPRQRREAPPQQGSRQRRGQQPPAEQAPPPEDNYDDLPF